MLHPATTHGKGRSPVWLLMCLLRCSSLLNSLPQPSKLQVCFLFEDESCELVFVGGGVVVVLILLVVEK